MLTIKHLPTEMLDRVCEYLVPDDGDDSDMVSFTLACKHFHSIAQKYRFSRIHLHVLSEQDLVNRLDDIKKELNSRFAVVRQIKVTGGMTGLARHDTTSFPRQRIRSLDDGFEPCGQVDAGRSLSHVPKALNCLSSWQELRYPPLLPWESSTLDEVWGPLAEFIKNLTGLQDLSWLCNSPLPCAVLDVLHQYSPGTRLHVHSFNPGLGVLLKGFHNEIDMLMKSPCLSTVVVNWTRNHEDSYFIFYYALMRILKSNAPNLRSVSVWSDTHMEGEYGPTWGALTVTYETCPPSKTTSLDTLVTFSPCTLALWTGKNQVGNLRDLTLTCQVGWPMIREMTAMVKEYGGYSSLEALRMRTWDDSKHPRFVDRKLSCLIEALPPLKTLELAGLVGGKTFDAMLKKHGQSLKRLRFEPAFWPATLKPWRITKIGIRKMVRLCPQLESLDVQLSIDMKVSDKIEACRELGRLPWLRHVCLDVAFKEFSPPAPRRRDEERYLYEEERGKRVLASSDAFGKSTLAIFKAISGENGPLADLRIHAWCSNIGSEPITQENDLKKPFWVGYTWVYQRRRVGSDIYFREILKRKKPFYPATPEMPEGDQARATREELVKTMTNMAMELEKASG